MNKPIDGRLWFWAAASIGFVAYGAMVMVDARANTLRAAETPTTILLYLLAFVGYGLVVWGNEHKTLSAQLLWVVPIGFRLLLLFTEPTLSDDVYRYLWDGHVLSNGANPYSYAIADPAFDRLSVPIRDLANNPTLASPYLPTSQVLFAVVATVLPFTVTSMQVVAVLFDLAAAAALYRLLLAVGLPGSRVVIYLWNPLVIIEAAHGAHLDSLMTLLAVLALWLTFGSAFAGSSASAGGSKRATFGAPIVLAMATLTRPVPILFAPVLWWRWSWLQRVLFAGALVAAIVPFGFGAGGWGLFGAPTGTGVFGSARVYSEEFRFNALPSSWLERAAESVGVPFTLVIGVLMAIVVAVVWIKARTIEKTEPSAMLPLLRLSMVPMTAYVLLTPVLHPWYLTIVMALMVFVTPLRGESAWRWLLLVPWMYLAASVVLSYLTYLDPESFRELDWVRRVIWLPTVAAFCLVGLGTVWSGRSGSTTSPDLRP